MEIKNLTCVECPMGCSLEVGIENGEVSFVKGNSCNRGVMYAKSEVIRPKRVLTTTVRCFGGKMLPVKTDRPVPRDMMIELTKTINLCHPNLPKKCGDIIIKDLYEDVNLIAAKSMTE